MLFYAFIVYFMSKEKRIGPHLDFSNDQLRAIIQEVLSPVYCMAKYRPPGLFERKDLGTNKKIYLDEQGQPLPEESQRYFEQIDINKSIIEECKQFSDLDVIDINPETEIVIGSSIAASPHTVLWSPYDVYEKIYRESADKFGLYVPVGPIIVTPESTPENIQTPNAVPLDGLVWVFRRNKNNGDVTPVDINDFASLPSGNPDIDKYKLNFDIPTMSKIFEKFARRVHIVSETNLRIFNEYTVKRFPFLPEKTIKDMLQGFLVGYFRGDYIKGLLQHYFSGEGKGPMSNATLHGRGANHYGMDMANTLNLMHHGKNLYQILEWMKDDIPEEVAPLVEQYIQLALEFPDEEVSGIDEVHQENKLQHIVRNDNYFRNEIQLIDLAAPPGSDKNTGQILKESLFGQNPKVKIEELLKMVDPFGTIMHDELIVWLHEKLSYYFYDQENEEKDLDISPFRHHTKVTERELRASEGISIRINARGKSFDQRMQILADALARITKFNGEILMPFWEDTKEFITNKYIMNSEEREQEMQLLIVNHALPLEIAPIINQVVPTERQVELAIENKKRQLQEEKSQLKMRLEQNIRLFNTVYASEDIMRKSALSVIAAQNAEFAEKMETIDDVLNGLNAQESSITTRYHRYKMMLSKKIEKVKSKIASGEGTTDDLIDYATFYQQGQIFDDPKWNTGLNISGVPGMIVTFNAEEDDDVIVNIGWAASTKGLLEGWTGGMVERQEKK